MTKIKILVQMIQITLICLVIHSILMSFSYIFISESEVKYKKYFLIKSKLLFHLLIRIHQMVKLDLFYCCSNSLSLWQEATSSNNFQVINFLIKREVKKVLCGIMMHCNLLLYEYSFIDPKV